MKQESQVELIKELLTMIDEQRAPDAGRMLSNPTSSYVSADLAEQEWKTLFQGHQQVLGFSGELPEPGSFLTNGHLGIPILATRDQTGRFRAFVNGCRHRGVMVTSEERGKRDRFVCPFHAWTYGSDGALLSVRQPQLFGNIDKSCHGLVELPSQEKYGLLVVHPQVGGKVDVDALLGEELAEQFSSWGFDRAEYLGGCEIDKRLNWKFANDTFGENYHFQTLHRSLSNILVGDAHVCTPYGRNLRMGIPGRFLQTMRTRPESQWSVTDAAFLNYYIFPNLHITMSNRVLGLFRVYPNRQDIGRCLTVISHYSAPHIGVDVPGEEVMKRTDEDLYAPTASQRIEFNLATQNELMRSTLAEEDYAVGEKSQLISESGAIKHYVFGRNEPALHHMHQNYREALSLPPLEEYRPAASTPATAAP